MSAENTASKIRWLRGRLTNLRAACTPAREDEAAWSELDRALADLEAESRCPPADGVAQALLDVFPVPAALPDGGALHLVLSALERQRHRIARELHDGVCQSLTAVLLNLEVLRHAPTLAEVHRQLADARRLTAVCLADLRRLARALRPGTLDDLGLVPALQQLAADYNRPGDPVVEMEDENLAERLPARVELALYRIAEEAVSNSARHAGAGHVRVAVRRRPGAVELTVHDDGRGFDPAAVAAGHGLTCMRERARLLGGVLEIVSHPGRETTVIARLPLEGEHHGQDPSADRR